MGHVQNISEPPNTSVSVLVGQARNDLKGPNEAHANEQFEVHDKLLHFDCPIISTPFSVLVGCLANDDHGFDKHDRIDQEKNANGYKKPYGFGFDLMEKAILFIESWSVGITILSREFSDEGAEGNEEREDITGDHVHSVSFCIGLTSTEKKTN